MNWLQFFASVINSLAWPLTALILAYLLRAPISRVLLTLTKLKYKNLELDFGRELKQVEMEAKAIEVKPQQPKTSPTEKKDVNQLLFEAERLAQDFPEPAVAVGWQAVEHALMFAVMQLAISPDYPPYNSAIKNIRLLSDDKVIDESLVNLLKRMGNLRNMAIHGSRTGGLGNVTTDEAVEFIALARGVIKKLEGLSRTVPAAK